MSQRSNVQYARDFIYKQGRSVKSKAVEALLCETSIVPTDVRGQQVFHILSLT